MFIALYTTGRVCPGVCPGASATQVYSSTYQYIHQYTLFIALYTMFSLKKRFEKLYIISEFELTISCRPQGRANHCTTSVDAEVRLCMV